MRKGKHTAAAPQGDDIATRVTVRYGGGIAPVLWADVVIVPERSERDTVRAATIGSGLLRESCDVMD